MTEPEQDRLTFIRIPPSGPAGTLREVVDAGLSASPKYLPCRFFYDEAGSELFERICGLPEYYLTRTEQAILERCAGQMIEAAGRDLTLVEFGSGSSRKTRLLLSAALRRQERLRYVPIDISADFLRASSEALLREYGRLSVTALAAEYGDGVRELPAAPGPRLLLFMGSNIGNFTREEAVDFLSRVRARMRPWDRMLIGFDLVKDRRVLEAAYDDSQGVTAAFNKNLLARINAELGGEFNLDDFDHAAPFDEAEGRVEMYLVSRRDQAVRVQALGKEFTFRQGEAVHTENSHKYSPEGFRALACAASLDPQEQWTDPDGLFAVALLKPV